jgi:hypothetical protein
MAKDLNALLHVLLDDDPLIVEMLHAVRALDLPDGWIAAGVVRNRVWDHLHGYQRPTPLNDIDVVYFDAGDLDEASEKHREAVLRRHLPDQPWSVKNQARMAQRNGDGPYRSTSHALEHWCETPTAVGIRLNPDDGVDIIAPLGLDDLFGLIVRPTPFALSHPLKLAQYRTRMKNKNWPSQWPRLRVSGF